MINQKKLYIILAIGAAVIAAIIILITALSGKSDNAPQSTPKNTASTVQTEKESAAPAIDDAETEVEEDTSEEENASEGVQIEIPVEELGKLVDAADDEYKSFEVLPVDSTNFFLGKKLRLVATFNDHQMTFFYDQNITATVTDSALAMNYKNSEGTDQTLANYVYAAPGEPFTSPGGRNFAIIAFGDHEITEENKEFSTDCFMLIKMRDDIDMSIAPADTYVMLIESEMPEVYELFRVEE